MRKKSKSIAPPSLGTLRRVIVEDPVLRASNLLLKRSKNAADIAKAAELVANRSPGGAHQRVRLWGRVGKLVPPSGIVNGARHQFADICKEVRIHPSKARIQIGLGETLALLRKEGVDLTALNNGDQQLFANAASQRTRAKTYIRFALKQLKKDKGSSARAIHMRWCQTHGTKQANIDIIKPSDWWAFSRPKWRRDPDFPGSIPGEVYANALFYFAPRRGVAVDPMAGSGMLRRVYRDRRLWQKDTKFDLTVRLFDVLPRRGFIRKHDASKPLPITADWIFIDPPYFAQSKHLYKGGLARTENYRDYVRELGKIISAQGRSLRKGGRLCVLVPKWSGRTASERNRDIPSDVRQMAKNEGLRWIDTAFVSRGRQQEHGFGYQNLAAKKARRMVSDTCVLQVFERN